MTAEPSIDWTELRRAKQSRFSEFMTSAQLDHVVVNGFDNFRWLIDRPKAVAFDSGHDYYVGVVAADGTTSVISFDFHHDVDDPFPDQPWITRSIAGPSWNSFWFHPEVFVRLLSAELRHIGAKRVGLESLNHDIVDALRQELPDVVFVPVLRDLMELRKIKLPAEIELLEHACKVSCIGMAACLNAAEEGVADREMVRRAVDAMYANGAEWISHHFITVNSPAGLFQAGGAHVWKGGTVKADLGCYATGGYAGDLCRVRFVGEPDPAVVNAYAGLLDAQRTVIAAAKPGTSCASIATDLNAGLRKRGLTMTPYAMGHGIGLRAMELPSIYRDDLMASDDRLEAGMVLCIEPSTTVQVDGETIKVANEDQYVVEADGLRQITLIGSAID